MSHKKTLGITAAVSLLPCAFMRMYRLYKASYSLSLLTLNKTVPGEILAKKDMPPFILQPVVRKGSLKPILTLLLNTFPSNHHTPEGYILNIALYHKFDKCYIRLLNLEKYITCILQIYLV